MTSDISLHVFTNCTINSPDTSMICRTVDSFTKQFGEFNTPVRIWCDRNPNIKTASAYHENLTRVFGNTVKLTSSLSEGYKKAILMADTEYMFMLEHDWLVNPGTIKHSLDEIIGVMRDANLYHFRFNKRENKIAGWDVALMECRDESAGLSYCISANMSNNPHIIHRGKYLDEVMFDIRTGTGSKGIEEELNKTGKYFSAIYGRKGYQATIKHMDGRRTRG